MLVTALLLSGCGQAASSVKTPTPAAFYDGEIRTSATTSGGSLRLELWRVTYTPGSSGTVQGRTLVIVAQTIVYLKLTNAGTSAVQLWEGVTFPDPQQAPFYLIDDQGRRFPARGQGWTSYSDTASTPLPTAAPSSGAAITGPQPLTLPGEGIVQPGETAEFSLGFGGIPKDVRELTLVMEQVQAPDGQQYTLKLPVPLP